MDALTPQLIDFIESQPMFFVATAAKAGRVNVSPKGLDTLRIDDPRRIRWLNLSGSGNETAAHVAATGRMTLMFCSFTDMPMILRVYGTARVLHPRNDGWGDAIADLPELAGSRQVFVLDIDSVATSCGSGVPVMSLDAIRADEELEPFYAAMSDDELTDYWRRKNTESIDGLPTGIFG
ncbi:MAG: pyridoxamine 5'-phosphate oxidase family protein [Actinomycetota bacterium]